MDNNNGTEPVQGVEKNKRIADLKDFFARKERELLWIFFIIILAWASFVVNEYQKKDHALSIGINSDKNLNTYTNQKYGYSFEYPSSWTAATSKYNEGSALFGPGASNESGQGGVEFMGTLSTDQMLSGFIREFNKNIESGAISETETVINGQKVIVSILPKAGVSWVTKSVAFLYSDKVFNVYLTDYTDKDSTLFDKVLSTFTFK